MGLVSKRSANCRLRKATAEADEYCVRSRGRVRLAFGHGLADAWHNLFAARLQPQQSVHRQRCASVHKWKWATGHGGFQLESDEEPKKNPTILI